MKMQEMLQVRILVKDGERKCIEEVLKPLQGWDLKRIEEPGDKLDLRVVQEIDAAKELFKLPEDFYSKYCIYLVGKNPTIGQIKEVKSSSQKIHELTSSPVYGFMYGKKEIRKIYPD